MEAQEMCAADRPAEAMSLRASSRPTRNKKMTTPSWERRVRGGGECGGERGGGRGGRGGGDRGGRGGGGRWGKEGRRRRGPRMMRASIPPRAGGGRGGAKRYPIAGERARMIAPGGRRGAGGWGVAARGMGAGG